MTDAEKYFNSTIAGQKRMCADGAHNAVLKMTSDAIDECMKERFYAIKDGDDELLSEIDDKLDKLERTMQDLSDNNHTPQGGRDEIKNLHIYRTRDICNKRCLN